MVFGINKLSHYFSAAARAERAETKERYNKAVDMLVPMVKSNMKWSPSGRLYDKLYGMDDATLKDISRGVMNLLFEEIRRPGEAKPSAKNRAIDLVFLNEKNLARGLPLDEKTRNDARQGIIQAAPSAPSGL
jgi:hypothetical protein